MKKILSIIAIMAVVMTFGINASYSAVNKQINANIKTKRVPEGTVMTLKLLDPVSSAKSQLGDQFDLMVVDNIIVDNATVIPQGSVVRGFVEEVQAPKMLYKGGLLRLNFDHIVSPTGKQVRFIAGIYNNKNVTYDGALSSKTNYGTAFGETTERTKNIVVKPTTWAWEKGDDMLNGSPKYVMAPVTAVVTAPVAGIYFVGDSVADLFKRGKNIDINQGDTIQVQLIKPIDMPVY